MNNANKKAQISIFIIMGIILLLGIITITTLNKDKIELFTDEKSTTKVRNFVDSCIAQETQIGIDKLKARGGWLYPPENILKYANINSNLFGKYQPEIIIKQSKGLKFFNEKIPYWYFYDDENEIFLTQIPSFNKENDEKSIKNQLEKYIKENLEKECLQNFEAFKDIYEINYNSNDLNVEIDMTNSKIDVNVNLPLEIIEINIESKEYIENFEYKTDNSLFIPYLMALDFTLAEINHSFLEYRTLSFINTKKGTDYEKNKLIPNYAIELGLDYKPRFVSDMKEEVQKTITNNLHLLQDISTSPNEIKINSKLEQYPFAKALNELYSKDYISETSQVLKNNEKSLFKQYENYEAKFNYATFYPISFRVDPSLGNILVMPNPQSFLGIIPTFMTEYTATYEITTPITLDIKSIKDSNDKPFTIALEINIDHNEALKDNSDPGYRYDALSNLAKPQIAPQLTCNPIQWVSKPILINITDPIDYGKRNFGDPSTGVQDAIVQFTCKNIETCTIESQTKINGKYPDKNITELSLRLPPNCEPGTLTIQKFGHKTLTINNINPNTEEIINLGEYEMPSAKELNIKISLKNPGQNKFTLGRELQNNESGFIIFEHKEEKSFVQVVEIDKFNQEELKVKLMPGNYSIKGFILNENIAPIKEETIEYDKNGILPGGKEEVILPQINITTWIIGSIEKDSFQIKTNDLIRNNLLILNLVDTGIPISYDSLQETSDRMGEIKTYSNNNEFEPYLEIK